MTPPVLTDRTQLGRQRARPAIRDAGFVHAAARDEVQQRLQEVNRSFTSAAIVCGHPALWADVVPHARLVADTPTLDMQPRAHDLVIHAMALHWADDPVGQLVQCLHALRPDGLFLAVMPGGRSLHELRAALAQAETGLRGGLSPRVAPLAEVREMGGLLQRAGFAMPVADSLRLDVTYGRMTDLLHDLRAMGEGNALAARDRRPVSRALFRAAERHYRAAFARPDGRLPATVELLFLAGWAPDAGQPRPLRPGSATSRLTDALRLPDTD